MTPVGAVATRPTLAPIQRPGWAVNAPPRGTNARPSVLDAKRATARRLGALERLHAEPRDSTPDLEAAEERRQLAETMRRLLDALPMEQRVAVVLCVVEERTSVEASEIMGVPEATVRTRLFHARRKMREMLEAEARAEARATGTEVRR